MVEIRKIIISRETIFSELGVKANRPVTRAVGMAVLPNPFAGQFVEDLRPLFEAKALSLALLAKWSMAVPASTQCSGNRCGPQSVAGKR